MCADANTHKNVHSMCALLRSRKAQQSFKDHFSKVDSTINQLRDLRIRAGEAAQQVEVPVSMLDCLSSVFRADRAEGEKWPSQTVL